MTRQKTIAPGETVGLKLSAAERKLIVDCLYVMDSRLQERVRHAAQNQDVPFTLDELEDLHGNLAFDANHTDDRKRERALDKILGKIERLSDFYCEVPPDDEAAPQPRPDSSTVPMICGSSEVPAEFRQVYLEIVSLTDEFCNERLNEEYQELCREMAISICQIGSPVARGKRVSWASGIVYSVGWINFLGDPSQEPHIRSEEIAKWFGVSTATMLSKAKTIREGLDLMQLDPAFTLPSRLDDNPLIWMLELDNGFIIDIRHAPREAQVAAYEHGLIPYVPADRDQAEEPYAVVHQHVRPSVVNNTSESRATEVAFQIKVTLDGPKPPIWRRLRVPDCTLDMLHEIIQIAMGWQNCHMHEFRAGDQRFSMAAMEEFGEVDDTARKESDVLLSELVDDGHKKLHYWYDFGDDWWHTIKIEKTLDMSPDNRHPACLAGARACPPEDIGGLCGYAEFLEATADPKHERHEELSEWYGGPFDPTRFDLNEVNERLTP